MENLNLVNSDPIQYPLPPKYGPGLNISGLISKEAAKAGDIVLANSRGEILFVLLDQYDALQNIDGYTPIAIVVVPASHTDDGTARCCSLKYMSTSFPDTGADTHQTMYWGYYGATVPGNTTIGTFEFKIPGTTTSGIFGNLWFVPSDNEMWNQHDVDNPLNPDPIAKKQRALFNTSQGALVISPYGADGVSKNPAYYTPNAIGAGCMNGKEDTQTIINYANTKDVAWLTQPILSNVYNLDGYYPAAFACQRYSTVGTKAGDWYLPAAGEQGYFIVRSNEIRKAMLKLGISDQAHNGQLGGTTWNYPTWGSTESSSAYVYCCGSSSGLINYNQKNNLYSVISFIAF